MKKKILIMQPELCVGGVERVLLTLLKNVNMDKYKVTLFLLNKGVWDDEIPFEVEVKYLFDKNPTKSGPFRVRLYKYGLMLIPGFILQKLIRLGQQDVYISFHEPMMNFLKGTIGTKIAWIHTDYSVVSNFPEVNQLSNKNGILARLIEKSRVKVFHDCDKIVCVAHSAKKGVIGKAKVDAESVICKYNLNDENRIKRQALEKVAIMDIGDETIKICSVGRFVEQKAFERFAYIATRLKSDGYEFKIFLVGDGPYKNRLEELIREKDLDSYIVLVGYDRNPYKYIAKSDLFVCTSLYEAFCTATTEAIILGVPLVTTDCSGMSELIGDTKAGLIVKNNEESLYFGLKTVLDNKSLLLEMKNAALIRGKEFEQDKLVQDIEDLFDES